MRLLRAVLHLSIPVNGKIKPLTEPCLRYLRTRLLNSTLYFEITITVQQYEGLVAENVGAKVEIYQKSNFLVCLCAPAT